MMQAHDNQLIGSLFPADKAMAIAGKVPKAINHSALLCRTSRRTYQKQLSVSVDLPMELEYAAGRLRPRLTSTSVEETAWLWL
mmetsp:Transcript_52076/g.93786  ORF Transcript_52076/g.93786 Transcript_52076/m.93786 type:complete len:83 (-) Transcript_52076:39-287(-)